jgi:hypothetical protein
MQTSIATISLICSTVALSALSVLASAPSSEPCANPSLSSRLSSPITGEVVVAESCPCRTPYGECRRNPDGTPATNC